MYRTALTVLAIAFLAAGALAADVPAAPLVDKTLVAWVSAADLVQQGGSVVTLIDPAERFDALVLGEAAQGKWMAGSDFFRRTHREQGAWPKETADARTSVQLAIVYRASRIALYRNGKPYAAYDIDRPQPFGDDAMVLLGLRYIGGMGEIGFFRGALDDVRIYDTALDAAQIAALQPNKPSNPMPIAWWNFEDGKSDDLRRRFPAARLEGTAKVVGGKLILDGAGYLWAAKSAKQLTLAAEDDTPFDAGVQTLFYKARSKRTGNMWDTWLYQHEGQYYLYYLANSRGQWDNFSMARSPDGVHWTEIGRVLGKGRGVTWMGTGSTWRSPNATADGSAREGDRSIFRPTPGGHASDSRPKNGPVPGGPGKYFLNFSEWKGPRQTIFFAESPDLVHWTRLGDRYEFVQDERWYEHNGRWDCIWTLPRPGGGLFGYWTATPKAGTGGQFGFGESLDGVTWKALPPPKVVGVGEGEVGAIVPVGRKLYMLFGTGGHMEILLAERPEGPFVVQTKNRQVLAGHTYFARFLQTPEALLVNHHSIARDGQVSMGVLKAAAIDEEGTLRLVWWRGNERLKHEPVAPAALQRDAATSLAMLDGAFDVRGGVLLEGTLTLPASTGSRPVGLYIEHAKDAGTAVLIHPGGVAEFGSMRADGGGFKAEQRVDRQRKFNATAPFRLLLKDSLCEFYLDDHLMQCYSLPQRATGRIGMIQGDAIGNLKAWRCAEPAAGKPSSDAAPPKAERIALWSGRAPVSPGQYETADAAITVHRPAPQRANGAAVVICPGGGYGGLVVGPEGHGIAQWLLSHGIAGIVLEYRLPHGRSMVPLWDAQRAIRTVRANAKAWNIDPRKIGIMGFSAGGHLASTAGTHFDAGEPAAADPVQRVSCRPDFMILVYPVVTFGEKTHGGSRANLLGPNPTPQQINYFSNEKQVTKETPPAYLAHALDDAPVPPVNSQQFYDALVAHGVPAAYLQLPSGGHGLNGYKGPMWDAWQTGSLQWLARQSLLPPIDAKPAGKDRNSPMR